ncbi:MAG TPA: L-seryl-tRNA(Sec) selenium transferase [Candidatus Cloacimonadota bacterium]|nr:L-seryl-tRNA(Sec) selenium transferase [Candidatus Cloacimonadota bacterium]
MKEELKKIPAVDKLLNLEENKNLVGKYGDELVKFALRGAVEIERENILAGNNFTGLESILKRSQTIIKAIAEPSLKPMVNATGVVLHTNLARAPLGDWVEQQLQPILSGYSNLEFDLETGKRGQRNSHISELIKFVTGAEDAVVVNNNAAAVMLCLKTFAEGGEAIISRGELIEIGGSFRIPDIMKASGATMIEVGTTNRTRLSDYENAITDKTKIILKAHKSNYYIGGFTEEVEIDDLVKLAKKHNLIFLYDLGSGLLSKPKGLPLETEPDVRSTLKAGVDIVTFSGDKLLGGPQAGIIAGKKKYVSKIAKAPMMRALRVGKMTIAALSAVIRCYLKDEDLLTKIPVFEMLNRDEQKLQRLAEKLSEELHKTGIPNEIVDSTAFAGGGTLPHLEINSKAVKLTGIHSPKIVFNKLLQLDRPILGILREGSLLFDVQSIFEKDINYILEAIAAVIGDN